MESCAFCDARAQYRDGITGAYLCPVHAWLEVIGPRSDAPRPPITIRTATPDDGPQIAELARHFRGEGKVESFGRTYQVDVLPAFAACDGDEIVGVVSYAREGDATNLVMLHVLPRWQGRGLARQLINAVIDMTRAEDAQRIIASTTNDDLPSLGLYQRLGFAVIGVLVGRLAEGGIEPRHGFDDIPVRDEIQLELRL